MLTKAKNALPRCKSSCALFSCRKSSIEQQQQPFKYQSFVRGASVTGYAHARVQACSPPQQRADSQEAFHLPSLLAYVGIDVSQSPGYDCGEERGDVDAAIWYILG